MGQVPPISDKVRNAQWSQSPNLIHFFMTNKRTTRDYAAWLRNRYEILNMDNGTLVARKRDTAGEDELYPYVFDTST